MMHALSSATIAAMLAGASEVKDLRRQLHDSPPLPSKLSLGSVNEPTSAAFGDDGSILVADILQGAVISFRPDGSVRWRIDSLSFSTRRRFRPYRIERGPRAGAIVYDLFAKSFIFVDSTGNRIMERVAPLNFAQVNDFVRTQSHIIVAGLTVDTRAASYSLHVFDTAFAWVRSFHALPPAKDNSRLAEYGVGTLERATDRTVLFSPKSLSPVIEVDAMGHIARRYFRREQYITPPESAFTVIRLANQGVKVLGREDTSSPLRAFPIGKDVVLYGFSRNGKSYYSSATPSSIESIILPQAGERPIIMAIDPMRCRLLLRTGSRNNRQLLLITGEDRIRQGREQSKRGSRCDVRSLLS